MEGHVDHQPVGCLYLRSAHALLALRTGDDADRPVRGIIPVLSSRLPLMVLGDRADKVDVVGITAADGIAGPYIARINELLRRHQRHLGEPRLEHRQLFYVRDWGRGGFHLGEQASQSSSHVSVRCTL